MNFAIAPVVYWISIGFDTTNWRKSVDGIQAIVHLEYVQVLVPNITTDTNITVYSCPSQELSDILSSTAWTAQEVI